MPHTKVCPNCAKTFVGRKNQTYCSMSCKAETNNRIQQEMRKGARAAMVAMEKNERIVKRFMHDAPLPRMSVSKEALIARGFNTTGPFAICYNSKGRVHYLCGNYYLQEHPASYIISDALD